MVSLREKVAQALSNTKPLGHVVGYDELADAAIAAVLDAMREPSKEMVEAAEKLWWLDWDNDEEVYITVTDVQAQQVWRAMLSAFPTTDGQPTDGE